MTDETHFAVYRDSKTVAESLYSNLVTGVMLAFCVYISHDSTWWTFVTGLLFMLFIFGRTAALTKNNHKEFHTKKELQAWVDGLPDD